MFHALSRERLSKNGVKLRNKLQIDGEVSIGITVKTTVLIDPTVRQIVKFRESATDGQLRGVSCGGHVYVFPAYEATHHWIRELLKLPELRSEGTDFWVIPEDEEPLSADWPTSDENLIRDDLRLIVGLRDDDPAMTYIYDWFQEEPATVPTAFSSH